MKRRGGARRPPLMRRLASPYGGYWPSPRELFPGWPWNAVHLPANRTGIMQSYQVLAGAVVRQSAAAGIRPIEFDPLPGTSADFLSLLLYDEERLGWMPPEERFGSLIEDFEKDLRAEIALDQRANSTAAVMAVTPEGAFPLSRASSMLSEMAPILLALKGTICRADHLTIDEPESHLHPAMQRKGRLVPRGCRELRYGADSHNALGLLPRRDQQPDPSGQADRPPGSAAPRRTIKASSSQGVRSALLA